MLCEYLACVVCTVAPLVRNITAGVDLASGMY